MLTVVVSRLETRAQSEARAEHLEVMLLAVAARVAARLMAAQEPRAQTPERRLLPVVVAAEEAGIPLARVVQVVRAAFPVAAVVVAVLEQRSVALVVWVATAAASSSRLTNAQIMFDDLPDSDLPHPRPVVSWAGGKARLLKYLLPLIRPHTAYVEVFGGGLALFLAKERSRHEVINDINGDLVKFYRNVRSHHEAILDELDLVLNSRRDFEDYCQQPGLTEIQRAARWFIRNKLSFAGTGTSFAITRSQPLTSRAQRLLQIQSLSRRLDRTTIEEKPWEYILKTYDHEETLFFLDPPYPEAGGKNYAGWDEVTVERFCTAVKHLRGQWIFTFKDCAQVRSLMAGYTFKSINRARGIANNAGKAKADRYVEIIITSERDPRRIDRKGRTA